MVAVVSAVSIMAYAVSLIKFRGKWIQQQIVFLVIYLVGLTLVGELDALLPIYFVVSLIPFLRHIRRISVFTGAILFYFIVYLLYGIVDQNAVGTIVTFVAKMWQFIVFFIVYDADIILTSEDYEEIIRNATIVETLLGLYLMVNSTLKDANGLMRLVSNSQPITGNISTVLLPIMVLLYVKNRDNARKTNWLLAISGVMLIWIVLSGTRGYTLEFSATMFLILYDYFATTRKGNTSQKNRALVAVVLVMLSILLIIGVPAIFEKMESILRLKSDVGIRTFENAAVIEFIGNTSIPVALFGIGLGGKASDNPAMKDALYRQFSLGMWDWTHYTRGTGALFHNLYGNVLLCLGIIGIVLLAWMIIMMWKRVTYSCKKQILMKRSIHLFLIGFLLMNYYRWSADCGISEMIILALILKTNNQID